ncbi:ribulose phosphate epimerase [Paraliomyxa miuraensis]|nr:ribulose phosphate epimerase [Paraliomyxa miuraensis]
MILSLMGTLALACGTKDDQPVADDGPSMMEDTGQGSTSFMPPDPSVTDSGMGMSSSSSSGGADESTTGMNFLLPPDGGGTEIECDIWMQDCPPGEKCMPWANNGGNSWNATRCSPVDENPGQVGDECMVEGSGVSGIDDCDVGSMCYYVDPETGTGTCVGFCEGSEAAPMCDDGFLCSISNDGVLILCRRECDPILQDCMGSAACLPANGSEGFVCIVDASGEGGAPADPCEYLNACDPGLFCANADVVPGCAGAVGCCSEFCDLSDADPDAGCSLMGQACEPWFEMGAEPPGLEHVGACVLPT